MNGQASPRLVEVGLNRQTSLPLRAAADSTPHPDACWGRGRIVRGMSHRGRQRSVSRSEDGASSVKRVDRLQACLIRTALSQVLGVLIDEIAIRDGFRHRFQRRPSLALGASIWPALCALRYQRSEVSRRELPNRVGRPHRSGRRASVASPAVSPSKRVAETRRVGKGPCSGKFSGECWRLNEWPRILPALPIVTYSMARQRSSGRNGRWWFFGG